MDVHHTKVKYSPLQPSIGGGGGVISDPPSLALAHLATGTIGPELLDLNYWTMNYWPWTIGLKLLAHELLDLNYWTCTQLDSGTIGTWMIGPKGLSNKKSIYPYTTVI